MTISLDWYIGIGVAILLLGGMAWKGWTIAKDIYPYIEGLVIAQRVQREHDAQKMKLEQMINTNQLGGKK